MENKIEEAKSGRSRCNSCGKSIDKGELRLGIGEPGYDDDIMYKWHHLKCAAKKHPDDLELAIKEFDDDIPDQDELEKIMEESKKKGADKKSGNVIELAKTNRSKCQICQQQIDKDTLRFGVEAENEFAPGTVLKWHHLKCAAEKKIDGLLKAMNEYKGEIKEKSDLENLINNG
jgi:hypothetical protein